MALGPVEQVLEASPDGVDRPEHVDRDHLLGSLDRHLHERPVVGDARVGDDEIEATGQLDELRDSRLDGCAVGDVARQNDMVSRQ